MTEKPQLLVVDDEMDMLDFIERVFRRDYRVFRAGSVDEAMALLGQHHIDVLITDQRMPKKSGAELLAHTARATPDVVRILLTGYSDAGEVGPMVDAYVTKPVDSDTLREAVMAAVARRGKA